MKVSIIGAGLAGCEAAWQLAQKGVRVALYEMKPQKYTPAHSYAGFAELVCSNSLKAMRTASAVGLLKEEMRRFGSLTLAAADASAVGAGGALAVDRERFSDFVTGQIRAHENITVHDGQEVTRLPEGEVIVATGPLTSDMLSAAISDLCGEPLSFYDAAAPIVEADSIDLDRAFFAARYDRGDADYINCPMNREEYEAFYEALIHAQTAKLHAFDKPNVYEGCMPVEVLARRGTDSIRYGPMKPVGLRDPRTGHRPWAVVQLRRDNAAGTLYNLVGFQTNLLFSEQKRVFSMIPGLEHARFMRYGVMHRNTFLNSPRLLSETLCLRKDERIRFAGQMTGVEGYMESAMTGILAGWNLARRLHGQAEKAPPEDTMCGALCRYVASPNKDFQPMGANMGLLPPAAVRGKQERYAFLACRALESMERFLADD